MTRLLLLHVNVLLSLFDPDHVHHDIAHDWFAESCCGGWASCPITENGFLRTANVARHGEFVSIARLIDHLRTFRASTRHEFWNDDLSLADDGRFDRRHVLGGRQITDVYLLGLAVAHDGCLATFDSRIPLAAVRGARSEHLQVLASAT